MSRSFLILASQAIKAKAKAWIDAAPFGTRIEFREAVRSNEQNSKMWASLTDVSKQVLHQGRRYDPDRWKVIFLYALGRETEFLPALDSMSFVPYGPRSSELSVAEMSELIEFIIAWGTERGVIFHAPEYEKGAGDEGSPPTPEKEARPNAPTLSTSTGAIRAITKET